MPIKERKQYDGPITASDINDIIRKYDQKLPVEDRQLLQGLRSAVTHQEYKSALHDVEITICLDKSGDDYVLIAGNGRYKILAHRDASDNVEIRLHDKPYKPLTCALREFGEKIIAKLEELFMKAFDMLFEIAKQSANKKLLA